MRSRVAEVGLVTRDLEQKERMTTLLFTFHFKHSFLILIFLFPAIFEICSAPLCHFPVHASCFLAELLPQFPLPPIAVLTISHSPLLQFSFSLPILTTSENFHLHPLLFLLHLISSPSSCFPMFALPQYISAST